MSTAQASRDAQDMGLTLYDCTLCTLCFSSFSSLEEHVKAKHRRIGGRICKAQECALVYLHSRKRPTHDCRRKYNRQFFLDKIAEAMAAAAAPGPGPEAAAGPGPEAAAGLDGPAPGPEAAAGPGPEAAAG